MRIFKSHPLLNLVNSYVIDSPQPSNLSYNWNFGSLLAFCLIIQIITGVTLAMHYNPSALEAFNSVEHIMRDVNNGWLIRYLHANTASAFFFLIYLHIGRGLYYGSYRAPRTLVWTIGTVIFILLIATAFLGYYSSPKWSKLNLSFLCIPLESQVTISIFSLLFTISFIFFYLDNFKLSLTYSIKCFQIFSFIGLLFIFILCLSDMINFMGIIPCINDKDINLHGHVSLDKEAAKHIGQGLNTIGSNIGLSATIAGLSSAVAKGLTKSSMPPLQKAGVILGAGILGGITHSNISNYNRNKIMEESKDQIKNNNIIDGDDNSLNKFFDDNAISSPLQDLLSNLEITSYTCLSLIFILFIQIIFKYYLNNNIKLNLFNLTGVKLNNKLEYYLNKIIYLNRKMSITWIWIIFILLIYAFILSAYTLSELYVNIDSYIKVHISIFNTDISNLNWNVNKLQDLLLYLEILNYIYITLVIILIMHILLKYHMNDISLNLFNLLGTNNKNKLEYYLNKIICLNKKMSIIYIWLILISLILALAFSGYTCNELYTNIDNYINLDNIKK